MGFWIFQFVMSMLIPIAMVVISRFFMKRQPKNINMFFGYRTARSIASKEAWVFAHRYAGKIMFWLGIIIAGLALIAMLFVLGADFDTIGYVCFAVVMVQSVALIGVIFPTERALAKNFNKNGTRKEGIEK